MLIVNIMSMNTLRTLIYFAARGARRLGCPAVRRSAMTLLVLLLSAATASAMQIFVRTIADKIITLEVEPTDAIEAVKAKIQERLEVAPESQYLVYAGIALKEGKTLSDYNIPAGSMLYLYNLVTLTDGTGDLTLQHGDVLTGTGGTATHVMVADGAAVTLSDVDITSITLSAYYQWAGISCLGDATIILEGDNNVSGGHCSSAIFVPGRNKLTIRGDGSLIATGQDYAAGIGGSHQNSCGNIFIESGTITATGGDSGAGIGSGSQASCGNITISGGTVTATGGVYAAGIGSGESTVTYSTCGDITILRTVVSVTATKGSGAPHSIGLGDISKCGTVTVGGQPGYISESPYTYTPDGSMTSTVHFDANGGSGEMADLLFTFDGTMHALPTCTFIPPEGKIFAGWNTAADGSGFFYRNGKQFIDIVDGTLYAFWQWPTETVPNGGLQLYDGQTLTGTGNTETHVTIRDGATVMLRGVDITAICQNSSYQWAGITCEGDATIILSGENAVQGGFNSAGIFVPEGKTLTIRGDGSLNATGHLYGAGIGCGKETSCGNIIIEGGTVTATGGSSASGIGSGKEASCGNITIEGGTVTATGGNYGPGIGAGDEGTCGNITFTGGAVTAMGGSSSAAIGCGYGSSSRPASCGDITITDGVTCVIATKTTSSSSVDIIGSSSSSSTCGTITIGNGLNDKTVGMTRYITAPGWKSTASVTLAKEGYGTYYSLFDLVLPAGMKARIVTASADGGELTYRTIADGSTAGNTVPAQTAVMLQTAAAADVQTFDVGLTVPSVDAITQTNLLGGSERQILTTGGGDGAKYYKLTYDQSGENIGWYWGADGGAEFQSAANKAWLALPASASLARSFLILPGFGEATGIADCKSAAHGPGTADPAGRGEHGAWYSTDGRRLPGKPSAKGLYIVNGRKVVIK